jgi:ribonuclease BN (tRNA processing enzyme)
VPAWGVVLTEPGGRRIVYAGDTAPNPDLVAAARDAELLVCEATLGTAAEDDPVDRGHLTLDEAVEHGDAARAHRILITHYPSARREAMEARLTGLEAPVTLARPDLVVEVAPARGQDRGGRSGSRGRPTTSRRAWVRT